jgi:predicted RNase H-like HicB family nuclease
MTYYLGIVDGSGDVWGVRIPDFPGCHGAGATVQDAVSDATKALREFATDMINDGEALPEARDMQAIDKALEAADEPDGIRVYIPLLVDKRRPVRANISLDAGLLEKIDIEAKRRGLTRSAFLASAAMDKIAEAR